MNDEEVFKLIDEEYGLSEKQEALNKIVHGMTKQLEKLKQREDEMTWELKRSKKKNATLRKLIKAKAKYYKSFLFSSIMLRFAWQKTQWNLL